MKTMHSMDLTRGNPARQILLFSLPLVIGTLFQQLYSFVDTVMVGRLIGEDALAAVGSTYSLSFLILGLIQGSCIGFAIPLAQTTGAKNQTEFKRYLWNGLWLCMMFSIAATPAAILLSEPLLRLIQTPESILANAKTYIQIIFLGLPAIFLYNYCAGTLRATGDSQRPTIFLLASSFLNIALDYVFIRLIPLGVAGAALATVISQLISGLLNLWWIIRKTDLLQKSSGLRNLSAFHIKKLCKVGIPMGFEYSVSALGAVVMQGAINSLGSVAIAGQTAGEKIRQMFTLPMESVGMGMATYVGQNHGAGRYDRIRTGIKAGIAIQLCYCAVAWVIIFIGKEYFTHIVLGTSIGTTAGFSIQYLSIISTLFLFHGCLMIVRNTLQGMGYSIHAVLSGLGELIGRALGGWLAVAIFGFTGICFANPLAWFFALLYCSALVSHFLRKNTKTQK